jgi:hypothetical protein
MTQVQPGIHLRNLVYERVVGRYSPQICIRVHNQPPHSPEIKFLLRAVQIPLQQSSLHVLAPEVKCTYQFDLDRTFVAIWNNQIGAVNEIIDIDPSWSDDRTAALIRAHILRNVRYREVCSAKFDSNLHLDYLDMNLLALRKRIAGLQ